MHARRTMGAVAATALALRQREHDMLQTTLRRLQRQRAREAALARQKVRERLAAFRTHHMLRHQQQHLKKQQQQQHAEALAPPVHGAATASGETGAVPAGPAPGPPTPRHRLAPPSSHVVSSHSRRRGVGHRPRCSPVSATATNEFRLTPVAARPPTAVAPLCSGSGRAPDTGAYLGTGVAGAAAAREVALAASYASPSVTSSIVPVSAPGLPIAPSRLSLLSPHADSAFSVPLPSAFTLTPVTASVTSAPLEDPNTATTFQYSQSPPAMSPEGAVVSSLPSPEGAFQPPFFMTIEERDKQGLLAGGGTTSSQAGVPSPSPLTQHELHQIAIADAEFKTASTAAVQEQVITRFEKLSFEEQQEAAERTSVRIHPSPSMSPAAKISPSAATVGSAVVSGNNDGNNGNWTLEPCGHASFAGSVLNMVNNAIGPSLLTLPWALRQSSVIPGLLLLIVIGCLNTYTLILLIRCCALTKKYSFQQIARDAFSDINNGHRTTFSRVMPYIVEALSVLYALGICISLTILIGNFVPSVVRSWSPSSIDSIWTNRAAVIAIVSIAVLLPLSCIKELHALQYVSSVAVLATLYTIGAVVADEVQYGRVVDTVQTMHVTPHLFLTSSLLTLSFTVHYNGPRYYEELSERSVLRFGWMTGISFVVVGLLYIALALAGYCRFGSGTLGNILDNYPGDSIVMSVARLSIVIKMTLSFPLVCTALRNSVIQLTSPTHRRNLKFRVAVTSGIVALIMLVAILIPQIEVLLGFQGAVFGSAFVYILPCVLYLRLYNRYKHRMQAQARIVNSPVPPFRVPVEARAAGPGHSRPGDRAQHFATGDALLVPLVPASPRSVGENRDREGQTFEGDYKTSRSPQLVSELTQPLLLSAPLARPGPSQSVEAAASQVYTPPQPINGAGVTTHVPPPAPSPHMVSQLLTQHAHCHPPGHQVPSWRSVVIVSAATEEQQQEDLLAQLTLAAQCGAWLRTTLCYQRVCGVARSMYLWSGWSWLAESAAPLCVIAVGITAVVAGLVMNVRRITEPALVE